MKTRLIIAALLMLAAPAQAQFTPPASQSDPGVKLRAVTPSDVTNITACKARSLYVGGAGNVAIVAQGDTLAVTLTGVAAGSVIPVAAKRVNSTNTTATLIVAIC